MDTPTPAEEGEPGNNHPFLYRNLLISAGILLLLACNPGKKEQRPAALPPDSVAAEKQLPAKQDTALLKPVLKKKIYLTFDDGPNKGTRNVLQAVKNKQVPVSFFIVGKHVFDSPEQQATWALLKADTSIELCNHSFTHASNRYEQFYKDPAVVVQDFQQSQERLKFTNHVTRMPGRNAWRIGSINITDIKKSKKAIDSVFSSGFVVMGWDLEWQFDHKSLQPDPDTALLLRRIRNLLDAGTTKTPGHLVLLAHDQAFQKTENTAILLAFLETLKANPEYEFIIASKYPGVQ